MRMAFRIGFFLHICASLLCAARVALLIGNADGGSEVTPLKFVGHDVKALHETLINYCGFKKEHIVALIGKGPDEVVDALTCLQRNMPTEEENILLLYYTGHADREALKMGKNRFPISDVKKQFSAFPASIRIGVFDACQSGGFTRLKGGVLAEPFLFRDTGNIKGEVILSSSSPTENAQESDLLGNSVFTFHFVNALRGSGDFSGDGRVTLAEAYQYTYHRTVASTARTFGGVQHPSYQFRIQGEGDVVLADLTTSATGILVENSIEGAVSIFDAFDNIMADFSKERSSRIIIALQAGDYQMVVTAGNGQKLKKGITVPLNKIVPLHLHQLEKMATAVSLRKGSVEGVGMGIGGGTVYSFISLHATERFLRNKYQGFAEFGIEPHFIEQSGGVTAAITAEIALSRQITILFGGAQWRTVRSSVYKGNETGSIGSQSYSIHLSLEEKVRLAMYDAGIRWSPGIMALKGLFLQTGVCWFTVDHYLNSEVYRELYDITINNNYITSGVLPVFYGGGGYRYHLLPQIALSISGRYRIQTESTELKNSQSENSSSGLAFRLRGYDIALSVLFTKMFGGRR